MYRVLCYLGFSLHHRSNVVARKRTEFEVEDWLEFRILFLIHPELDELELGKLGVDLPGVDTLGHVVEPGVFGFDPACETYSWMLSRSRSGTGAVCLSRSSALTIFSSISNIGDTPISQSRGDFIEVTDVGVWVLFVISEELLVLDKS
ncbi:hypothetical protein Tco_0391039 [Tanacetum coccineum]